MNVRGMSEALRRAASATGPAEITAGSPTNQYVMHVRWYALDWFGTFVFLDRSAKNEVLAWFRAMERPELCDKDHYHKYAVLEQRSSSTLSGEPHSWCLEGRDLLPTGLPSATCIHPATGFR